jgi:hypothetical protein
MSRFPHEAPGPFRASMIREGDPYELSNGHPILCLPGGQRHGDTQIQGGKVLSSDPAIDGAVGTDVGIAFNDDKNLRAPDLSVGGVKQEPGWMRTPPPLAVEYADRGQDETELTAKIGELLAFGVRLIWVVRLTGPLRVEVHAAGQPVRVVDGDGTLTAPGILQNPVPVRALVDRDAANAATLRNLLNQAGYEDLAAVERKGELKARAHAILTILQTRGMTVSDSSLARLHACTDFAQLDRWLRQSIVATSAEAALD